MRREDIFSGGWPPVRPPDRVVGFPPQGKYLVWSCSPFFRFPSLNSPEMICANPHLGLQSNPRFVSNGICRRPLLQVLPSLISDLRLGWNAIDFSRLCFFYSLLSSPLQVISKQRTNFLPVLRLRFCGAHIFFQTDPLPPPTAGGSAAPCSTSSRAF